MKNIELRTPVWIALLACREQMEEMEQKENALPQLRELAKANNQQAKLSFMWSRRCLHDAEKRWILLRNATQRRIDASNIMIVGECTDAINGIQARLKEWEEGIKEGNMLALLPETSTVNM